MRPSEFYCGLLGFRVELQVPASETKRDPCYMGVSRDAAVLYLSSHAGDGVIGGALYVISDDVDALHEEFVARNVRIRIAKSQAALHRRTSPPYFSAINLRCQASSVSGVTMGATSARIFLPSPLAFAARRRVRGEVTYRWRHPIPGSAPISPRDALRLVADPRHG
jgi:hypothetical protein